MASNNFKEVALKTRTDFVFLFEARNSNPNGDPDANNMPRVDPQTLQGYTTDVSIKRKVRDWVDRSLQGHAGYEIYVKHLGILANEQKRAFEAVKAKPSKAANEEARNWMCQNFFDVRTFGAVMTTGKAEDNKQWNCGQVRGPVQFAFATSVDPVYTASIASFRVALTNFSDTKRGREVGESDEATSGTFARLGIVPYGLYRMEGYISPSLAASTGFNERDRQILWQALWHMFDEARSHTQAGLGAIDLLVFEHSHPLGNADARSLFKRVTINLDPGVREPRDISHYTVNVDEAGLQQIGVRLQRPARLDAEQLSALLDPKGA